MQSSYYWIKFSIAVTLCLFIIGTDLVQSTPISPFLTYFESIRDDTLWPLPSPSSRDNMTSTFGPRIKASSQGYDFHRGIDIHEEVGVDVFAPYDGTFYGVQTYSSGGLTLRIRHRFPTRINYGSKSMRYYYTWYMHLDSIDPTVAAMSYGDYIYKGQKIAEVGTSGSVVSSHLHFELRVGTQCSLEYQIDNPSSGCSGYGVDPHMHPLFMFPPAATNGMTLTLSQTPSDTIDGKVQVGQPASETLMNRITYTISDGTNVVASHILDLNERIGFDATTNAALDTPDFTKPYISPISFSRPIHKTDIILPTVFTSGLNSASYTHTLEVLDIWERSSTITW